MGDLRTVDADCIDEVYCCTRILKSIRADVRLEYLCMYVITDLY